MGWRKALQLARRGLTPYPLHETGTGLVCRPTFILSTGRSGSTLLRAMLMAHDDLCIPPESFVLGHVIRQFRSEYRFLRWPVAVRLVAFAFAGGVDFKFWDTPLAAFVHEAEQIPERHRNLAYLIQCYYLFYAQKHKPEATRWGDKSTNNLRALDGISDLYPQAQYIHIYRDGRDVVASRLARGWHEDLDVLCDRWLENIGVALNTPLRKEPDQFLEIRYEDLVSGPEPVIRRTAAFLDLPFQSDMLQPQRVVDQLGDADRDIHASLAGPISPEHIGKWRRTLSPADQQIVQSRLGPMLERLGYSA